MRLNMNPNIHIGRPPVSVNCPRCSFKMDFDKVEGQVLHEVTQEILSRIRTDRFRAILHERAINQQSGRN